MKSEQSPAAKPQINEHFPANTVDHKNKGATNWALLKNGVVLSIGRNINSMLRLVIAAIVARGFGADTFAEYSMILAVMMIAEWFLDFGTTDVFVREVSKKKHEFSHRLAALCRLKGLQTPLSIAALFFILFLLQPAIEIYIAGALIALGLIAYALVSVYRAVFKASLTLEKEMLAEFISIVLMIPLVLLSMHWELGILGIAAALCLSRVFFLLFCMIFSQTQYLAVNKANNKAAIQLWKASYLIGCIGIFSVVNNAIEILLLSRLSSLSDVAIFSAAQKLVWPLFMILTAVGTVFYPVLASCWTNKRDVFQSTVQNAFNIISLLGFVSLAGIFLGAEFLMGLISSELVSGVDALHLLLAMCLIKSFSAALGPILFIVGAEKAAFSYFAFSVLVKSLLVAFFSAEYGYIGTALISLGVELLVVFPFTLYFLKTKAQVTINFFPTVFLALSCTLIIYIFESFIELESWAELLLAPLALLLLLIVTKQAKPDTVLQIIKVRKDVT